MGGYNKTFAAIMVGAFVTVLQVMIQALAPDHFWTLVQNNVTFWSAVTTLLVGFVVLVVPDSTKEVP